MAQPEVPVASEEMASLADEMGLLYEVSSALDALPPETQKIQFWISVGMLPNTQTVNHHVHGTLGAVSVNLFDLAAHDTVTLPGEARQTELTKKRSIIVLPSPELPDLCLKPNSFTSWLFSSMSGSVGVSFDANAVADDQLAKAVKDFSKFYMLKSPIIEGAIEHSLSVSEASSQEAAIRAVFTAPVIQRLLGFQRFSLAVTRGMMIVWRGTGYKEPQERAALLEDALAIREILIDAVTTSNPGKIIPAWQGGGIEEQAWQLAGARQYGLTAAGLGFLAGLLSGGLGLGLILAAIGNFLGMRLGRFRGPRMTVKPQNNAIPESRSTVAVRLGFAWVAGFMGFWIGLALGFVPVFLILSWFRPGGFQPVGLVETLITALPLIPLLFGLVGLFYGFKLGKRVPLYETDNQYHHASQKESG